MKNTSVCSVIAAALFSISATNTWAGDAKIDCTTAQDDIATLQGEKKKVEKHKSKGLFSITPIGMLVSAADGSDKKSDSNEMKINEYNAKIDAHIDKIKSACGDGASSGSNYNK